MDDELDIVWEEEKVRRSKSYEYEMRDVGFVKGHVDECGEWNNAKVSEWARKFREITGN